MPAYKNIIWPETEIYHAKAPQLRIPKNILLTTSVVPNFNDLEGPQRPLFSTAPIWCPNDGVLAAFLENLGSFSTNPNNIGKSKKGQEEIPTDPVLIVAVDGKPVYTSFGEQHVLFPA